MFENKQASLDPETRAALHEARKRGLEILQASAPQSAYVKRHPIGANVPYRLAVAQAHSKPGKPFPKSKVEVIAPKSESRKQSERNLSGIDVNPEGFSRASRGLTLENFPRYAANYMNPYQERVVNEISRLGNRNFTENILPALEAKFVRLGQHGSARHQALAERAARDMQESILGKQAEMMHQGYTTAADIFNRDRIRQIETSKALTDLEQTKFALKMAKIEALLKMGQITEADAQRMIDYNIAEYEQERRHPIEMLGLYNNMISGHPYSTNTYTTTPSPSTSMHSQDYAQAGLGLLSTGLGHFLNRKKAAGGSVYDAAPERYYGAVSTNSLQPYSPLAIE